MAQMYNALVEVDRKVDARDVHEDEFGDVLQLLAQHHPALSVSPRGWAEARISLPAESLAQASATACVLVGQAFGAEAIAAQVMTEAEFLARQGWEPVPELVSVTEAAELLGVTRQAVLDRISRKTLPATKVGEGRTSGWVIPREALAAVLARPHTGGAS